MKYTHKKASSMSHGHKKSKAFHGTTLLACHINRGRQKHMKLTGNPKPKTNGRVGGFEVEYG